MRKGERLADLVAHGEAWLMARILHYAKDREYTKYTSTLEDAWRLSVAGLSERLIAALAIREDVPKDKHKTVKKQLANYAKFNKY